MAYNRLNPSPTPPAGSVTPAMISTVSTSDFVFPRDVTATRNFFCGDGVTNDSVSIKPSGHFITIRNETLARTLFYIDAENLVLGMGSTSLEFNGSAGVRNALYLIAGTVTPDASAIIQANSTTQGVLLPRMTTTQKNAISSPTPGLMVYDTSLGKVCIRGAAAWETVTSV